MRAVNLTVSFPRDESVVCALTNAVFLRHSTTADLILRLRRIPAPTWLQRMLA